MVDFILSRKLIVIIYSVYVAVFVEPSYLRVCGAVLFTYTLCLWSVCGAVLFRSVCGAVLFRYTLCLWSRPIYVFVEPSYLGTPYVCGAVLFRYTLSVFVNT